MPNTFEFSIQTSEGLFAEYVVEELILPTITGKLGILPNHAPLLTVVEVGLIRFRCEGSWITISVKEGFAYIESSKEKRCNSVSVLCTGAEGESLEKS
jgi:F-type H+-transporting ATPase subunit epsilon